MQPVPRMERRISLGFMPVSYILVYRAMVVLQISPYKEIPRKITPPKISIFLSFVSPLQGEKISCPLNEMNDCLGSISLYGVQ